MNSSSGPSDPANCGATLRPINSGTEAATAINARAHTAHAARTTSTTPRAPDERVALSLNACGGETCSNSTSGSASAQREMVRTRSAASAAISTAAMVAAIQNAGGRTAM
jgi:hypothetical protein